MNDWGGLLGMRIIESPLIEPVPVLQLSYDFKWCSDGFRADMNKWLLDMFGKREVAYMMNMGALGIGAGRALLINPRMVVKLNGIMT